MEKLPILLMPEKTGFKLLKFSELAYAKAEGGYVRISTAGGDSVLLTGKLKKLEALLHGPEFFRCHHSWLVNLHFVEIIKTDDGAWGLLIGGEAIPVSREKRRSLMERVCRL
jgi:two-component system, LytTR family, response regulator